MLSFRFCAHLLIWQLLLVFVYAIWHGFKFGVEKVLRLSYPICFAFQSSTRIHSLRICLQSSDQEKVHVSWSSETIHANMSANLHVRVIHASIVLIACSPLKGINSAYYLSHF